jgi:hypothetical protein
MTTLDVREVRSAADIRAFLEAGRRAQMSNPRWIEPVRDEIRLALDPRRSPLTRESEIQAFIAFRNGEPVGRIAAIASSAHLEKYRDACGHFGLIDAIDDPDVFAALFESAANFLRRRGLRRMLGPFSLSINHEIGVLVHGFDQRHVVRTNHSPPHYARRIEALGLRKAVDVFAFICRPAQSDFPERVAALARRFPRAGDIQTHGLTMSRWTSQFGQVQDLYNDAWRDNWSSTPVSPAEAEFIARLMRPVCKPAWIRMARWRGENIAVVAQIPDVNEALQGLGGRLAPFGWARLLWRIHGRGTRMTRIPMIGVARRWRGTPVGSMAVLLLLAEAIAQARAAGIEEIEISWMLEANVAVLNLVKSLPARHSRTFRIYEREL